MGSEAERGYQNFLKFLSLQLDWDKSGLKAF